MWCQHKKSQTSSQIVEEEIGKGVRRYCLERALTEFPAASGLPYIALREGRILTNSLVLADRRDPCVYQISRHIISERKTHGTDKVKAYHQSLKKHASRISHPSRPFKSKTELDFGKDLRFETVLSFTNISLSRAGPCYALHAVSELSLPPVLDISHVIIRSTMPSHTLPIFSCAMSMTVLPPNTVVTFHSTAIAIVHALCGYL